MKYILKIINMNNIRKNIFLLTLMFILANSVFLFSEEKEVVLDSEFFKYFSSRQIIQRDDQFESIINRIVIGRGVITGISVNERYKKKFRVIIEASDSAVYNQKIIFFVFLENKDTVDLLSLNSKFEFKGQLVGSTPLGTKRNEYILDVILMDGSTVIE